MILLATPTACTTHEPDETQPASNVTTFDAGPPAAPSTQRPAASRTDAGGVVSRSYKVAGTGAGQVLQFNPDALAARRWIAARPVGAPSFGTYRGVWTGDRRVLTVSAPSAPTPGQDDAAVEAESQCSLSLRRGGG